MSSERFSLGSGSVATVWAMHDRVIVLEDEFKSGYGCPRCNPSGTDPGGVTYVGCPACNATGKHPIVAHARCNECMGSKKVVCPDCGGKGGLLVVAQETGRRPSSGTIVSAGSECKYLKVGDAVLFSNHAGYVVDLGEKALRILHEPEILAGIEGHLTLSGTRYKTELAEHAP